MRKTMLFATVVLLISTVVLQRNNAAARTIVTNAGSPGVMEQTAVPADPTGLTVTEITSSTISIAWTDNSSDEDGFKIERCSGANCNNFQLLAIMPAGVTSITDWGLGKNKTFKYRVCAYNYDGDSGYTNTTTATTSR